MCSYKIYKGYFYFTREKIQVQSNNLPILYKGQEILPRYNRSERIPANFAASSHHSMSKSESDTGWDFICCFILFHWLFLSFLQNGLVRNQNYEYVPISKIFVLLSCKLHTAAKEVDDIAIFCISRYIADLTSLLLFQLQRRI